MPPLVYTSIVPRLDMMDNNTINSTIYPIRIDNEGIPHLEENNISRIVKDSGNFYTSMNTHDNLGQLYRRPPQIVY